MQYLKQTNYLIQCDTSVHICNNALPQPCTIAFVPKRFLKGLRDQVGIELMSSPVITIPLEGVLGIRRSTLNRSVSAYTHTLSKPMLWSYSVDRFKTEVSTVQNLLKNTALIFWQQILLIRKKKANRFLLLNASKSSLPHKKGPEKLDPLITCALVHKINLCT